MLEAPPLPDLTFPAVRLGPRETPWDLLPLLYRGGAQANVGKAAGLIQTGALGTPLRERVDLVALLHAAIEGKLAVGKSQATQLGVITALREFYAWADSDGRVLRLDTVVDCYISWADALLHRVRVLKSTSMSSVYHSALRVSGILDDVLGRTVPLIQLTRLEKPKGRKSAQGVKADKQNLEWTFGFGRLLQDLCDGLTLEAIWGTLPFRLTLRNGSELVDWSGMKTPGLRVATKGDASKLAYSNRKLETARAAYIAEHTLRTRYPLTNLRVEAELLMFVGQTGMNLGQAHRLQLRDFYYSSDIDGYKVGDRKNRRGGEVLFEIYREYRAHFERYLAWRREMFPSNERLFPFVTRSRADLKPPQLSRMRNTCKKVGVAFVSPSALRSTRVNWLLRRSGDPDMTAEMAQHTKETLLKVYEVPSLQRAMGETLRFWSQTDPSLARTTPVAPGECDGVPVPVKNIPKDAPQPDCVRASGCLWCEHHRDIDSPDHVWALGSFRHLKVIEISKYRGPAADAPHPAERSVGRLSEKLRWFKESNELRRGWVEEALARIEEESYHPDWAVLIQAAEGAPQ